MQQRSVLTVPATPDHDYSAVPLAPRSTDPDAAQPPSTRSRGNGTASTPAPPVVAKVIRHHLTFKVNARRLAAQKVNARRLAAQNVILFLIPDAVLGADGAIRRREFIVLLGGAAAVWPLAVTAQSPSRVYRVGSLITGTPIADDSPYGAALIRGLAEHGYVLNRNLMFEHRGAEMQLDRLPRLVDELVTSKKVDVIVAFGYPSALAAKEGTTLPVVSFTTGDPVGTRLVDGLARPGGHVTGISDVSAKITPKRLGLLKEMAPALRRVAMLWNAADPGMTMRYRAAEAGATTMGIIVQPLPVREPKEFDQAFAAMNKHMPDAILMVHDALASLNRKRVFEFVAAHRLPAIYEDDLYVRDGGLMSYGPDSNESLARVAALVDRILKGAKPAELPFEQPTLFRFVLNLKTAKSLGLTVPLTLRTSADEMIE